MKANRFNFRALSDGKWWYSDDEAYTLKMFDGELWLCEDNHYYSNSEGARYSKIGKAIQSTGLTDRNGVEIFEGAAVCKMWGTEESWKVVVDGKTYKGYLEAPPVTYAIYSAGYAFTIGTKKNPSYCGVLNDSSCNMAHGLEVIGNIHENPELLEGVKC